MTGKSTNVRVFEALANPYRQQVLFALVEANPQDDHNRDPMGLLADGETDNPAVTQIALTHTHLPKLADMGFIEWNRETGEISKGPDWDEIAPLLQLLHDHRDELPESWLPGQTSARRE